MRAALALDQGNLGVARQAIDLARPLLFAHDKEAHRHLDTLEATLFALQGRRHRSETLLRDYPDDDPLVQLARGHHAKEHTGVAQALATTAEAAETSYAGREAWERLARLRAG